MMGRLGTLNNCIHAVNGRKSFESDRFNHIASECTEEKRQTTYSNCDNGDLNNQEKHS